MNSNEISASCANLRAEARRRMIGDQEINLQSRRLQVDQPIRFTPLKLPGISLDVVHKIVDLVLGVLNTRRPGGSTLGYNFRGLGPSRKK
jgi:hypothetical protein